MEKSRRSRGVRLATLFAACLASATAFGLHPEPESERYGPPIGIDLPAARAVDAGSHDCLACRAHRPILPAPTPADVTGLEACAARAVAPLPPAIRVFAPLRLDGRSPPVTS